MRVIGSLMVKMMSVRYAATSRVRFICEQDTFRDFLDSCCFPKKTFSKLYTRSEVSWM